MNATWESAAKSGDAERLDADLKAGAAIDARDRFGQTALMLAALHGHEQASRVLVDAGADLNVTAKFGLSALMLAVINHHQEIARLIAKAGADVALVGTGASGFFGKCAADFARDRGLNQLADELDR